MLLVGETLDIPARVREKVPNSFVRAVGGNPGFGAAANEVLRLVEGDNGFFCFLHDDVALDPGAIRLLVEELYRSNAGVVGPKLVSWDEPRILQHVGLAVDRLAEVDPIVEPGEFDQEQHDAVRDVFALPTACVLVRADLFRSIGGFDPVIEYHGDDVDLCWRAHLSGARVMVVPAARGRHVEALAARRPDLAIAGPAARNRMRTVATLTGAGRLPLILLQLTLMTIFHAAFDLVRGRLRNAVASLVALVGMLGSRRKVAMTAGVLRSWSVSEEAIDRMHAPVGLSIGADTPEEIAISVVAEMIAVRRDGSRRRGGVQIETAEVSP